MERSTPLQTSRGFPHDAVWLVGFLMILMVAFALYFRESQSPAGAGVEVAAVTGNPDAFVGRTVTVQGAVERMIGTHAFILEDAGPGGEMLVVATKTETMPPAKDLEDTDDVRVVGEVRRYDPAIVRTEVGLSPTDERLAEVKDKPVLYAFQVIVAPGAANHARADAERH